MRSVRLSLLAALAVGLVPTAIYAVPISYSTGFETSDSFNSGNVVPYLPSDLNGWGAFDGGDPTAGLPTLDITNAVSKTGAQSLRIKTNNPLGAFNSAINYTLVYSPLLTGAIDVVANGTPQISIKWDMRVDDPASDVNLATYLWSLDVADTSATPVVLASVGRFLEDLTTPALYGTTTGAAYQPLGHAGPASGAWGSYELLMNYTAGTWQLFLDSSSVGTGLMAAGNGGLDINFQASIRGTEDVAYIDNFSVTSVPEPTSLALIGLGALAMLRRRRAA